MESSVAHRLVRGSCMLLAGPLLTLGSCGDRESDVTRGQAQTDTTTAGPATTAGATDTAVPASVVTLPPDDRSRTPPGDATADFSNVRPAASFDQLASSIVAAVERAHPAGAATTESASAASETTGTVTVRRHGFADDSLAGYEYVVTVAESAGQWTILSATRSAICYRGVTNGVCT